MLRSVGTNGRSAPSAALHGEPCVMGNWKEEFVLLCPAFRARLIHAAAQRCLSRGTQRSYCQALNEPMRLSATGGAVTLRIGTKHGEVVRRNNARTGTRCFPRFRSPMAQRLVLAHASFVQVMAVPESVEAFDFPGKVGRRRQRGRQFCLQKGQSSPICRGSDRAWGSPQIWYSRYQWPRLISARLGAV